MRLVWSLVLAWCLVASAAPRGPHDRPHHAGVSNAPAYHHPVRNRDLRSQVAPFIAPPRTILVAPARSASFVATPIGEVLARITVAAAVARGPPQA